jgi:hypothetical protein
MYCIQDSFICRPSDSTVSEDAGIEPRTVATTALTVRRSNHKAKSHPQNYYVLLWRGGGGILFKCLPVRHLSNTEASYRVQIRNKNLYFLEAGTMVYSI